MKNLLLGAVMILIVLFAFSFSGSSVMVTKPIAPKQTVAFTVYYAAASPKILQWAKKGFVVTHTETTYSNITVVMVKY